MHPRSTLAALALLAACRGGPPDHTHEPPPAPPAETPQPPPANAVQAEMRVLQDAARDWVTAIAGNRLEDIPAGLHRVHAARTATEQALESGAYRPPKNGDQLEGFKAMDEAFHGELVKLLNASRDHDAAAAARQVGTLLEACVACHGAYRF